MALYMLDTDTVLYLIRGKTPALDERIAAAVPAQLCISAITRGELLCGLSRQLLQGKVAAAPTAASAAAPPVRRQRTYIKRDVLAGESRALQDWPRSISMDQSMDQEKAESLRRMTHSVLAQLTPIEAKILRRRFGIDTSTPHTLEEVGRQFDATRERLRQGALPRWSQVVDQFLARVACLPWDEAAATQFASVAAELYGTDEFPGTSLGSMDMMIAGHAIAADAVLVTTHERELGRVAGLKVENWTWDRAYFAWDD